MKFPKHVLWLNKECGLLPDTYGNCEEAVLLMTIKAGKRILGLWTQEKSNALCIIYVIFPLHLITFHFPYFPSTSLCLSVTLLNFPSKCPSPWLHRLFDWLFQSALSTSFSFHHAFTLPFIIFWYADRLEKYCHNNLAKISWISL